ncbi:hypothetical protein ABZ567_31035 [Streptomyces sp. NPDC016459]
MSAPRTVRALRTAAVAAAIGATLLLSSGPAQAANGTVGERDGWFC